MVSHKKKHLVREECPYWPCDDESCICYELCYSESLEESTIYRDRERESTHTPKEG